MKIYYIVNWNENSWQPFLQYQIGVRKCYKVKEGFICVNEYRKNIKDCYYGEYIREDFCFKAKKEDMFKNKKLAIAYALEKTDIMYLSRQKHLIKERDEAIKKIKKEGIENE